MFPDIVRDDIFRIETRRLWLRWPSLGEADAALLSGPGAALPEAASGDPYAAARPALAQMRDANASGAALHLVITGRSHDRTPLGTLGLTPIRARIENCGLKLEASLDPSHRGQGLMTEAVQAVIDAAFLLTGTPLVAASARVRDPAFRRVLEKCGFSYCGHGLDAPASGPGLVASDRFRLDRKAWASLKAWRVPGLVRAREPDERHACA